MRQIKIKATARYYVMLLKNDYVKSDVIDRITKSYKKRGWMFFWSEISWFKLVLPVADHKYL